MLDQLSCAVGVLHFGEIWNQLGEGGPNCPNVSPAPGPLSLPHGHGTGSATDTDAKRKRPITIYVQHLYMYINDSVIVKDV